ncbi:condensation domain-containing protein [Rhodovulum sp. 12E13]|uniref:condensation domain-containing protein n=1 Tax=Rhodovulum sp. 12E13 TaxID=2203891 RepID=UPI0011C0528F|nr:condensation domain-containing protein [Rhodovulum sp. 12E13]
MSRQSPQTSIERFPASPAQARFWFLERVRPGNPDNAITLRWRVTGDLPTDALEAAFRAVIHRHEALRTCLVEEDGAPLQEVRDAVDFKLGLVDIRALPIDDHEARIARIAADMAGEPFDLGRPPLLRATHVRTGPGRATLLVTAHHCVFDGWSGGLLGREIGALAAEGLTGRPADLPELSLHYPDYALWQEACATSPARADEIAFWSDTLAGAAHFALPPDVADPPAEPGAAPRRLTLPLPADVAARLPGAAARLGASPFMVGAAAASAVLAAETGAPEVLLATPVSGRDEVDLEPLVGVFVNTIVLRLPAPDGASGADHLERTRAAVEAALAHQSCPLEEVMRAAPPPRPVDPGEARTPYTSVAFGLSRGFLEGVDHGSFRIEGEMSQTPGALYPLNLNLVGDGDGWTLVIDHDGARHSDERIAALGQRVIDALGRLVETPSAPLLDAPPAGRAARSVVDAAAPAGAEPAGAAAPAGAEPAGAAAPCETRARLARLWADLLGLPEEACAGDFFALGGHSILALRMLARAEAEFGRKVEVAAFLADPTLDGLAARLSPGGADAGAEGAGTWSIVPLRGGDRGGPVIATVNQTFLWHGIARAFAPGRTVVNLTVPDRAAYTRQLGMDGATVADDAAATLAGAFPGRPLVLVGHCADGLTALATAHALAARGHDVPLLALTDAWSPEDAETAPPRAVALARRVGSGLMRWSHYLGRAARGRLGPRDLARRLGPVLRLMRAAGLEPRPTEAERLAWEVNAHHQRVWAEHDFGPWPGEALLFATESQPARAAAALFGWRGILTEDTPVLPLEGWHEDALLGGGFERMARVIDLRLDRQGGLRGGTVGPAAR